jgi:hypothetical protein
LAPQKKIKVVMNELIPIEIIETKIFIIRGQKVMLDRDLATLYDVETKRLNEAVKRNLERFPERFMFQLTDEEWVNLRSQFEIANSKTSNLKSQIATSSWGGKRKLPYVFTEHGTLMLSSVLNSKRAISVSIQIIEVFDKLKQFALKHNELAERISSLEQAFMTYSKENTEDVEDLRKALNLLLDIHQPTEIGFKS